MAQARYTPATQSWEQVIEHGLRHPIGAPPLRDHDLRGKKVAVIVDDWGRPTPAHRVLPAVLREVHAAGARVEDVTVLTGTGVHLPMDREDLVRKVGQEVAERYRCVPHDAFEESNMVYIGLSPRGTPLWINRLVAEADFKVVVGRIAPHNTHGYEGGAKMITPATSHWLTVLRNHSCNFSPYCEYGSYGENPSRADVDDIGGMVHLEYIVNFVVNRFGEPLRAFCGHRLLAHRAGHRLRRPRGVGGGDRAEGRPDHRHPGRQPGPRRPRPLAPGAGGHRHPGPLGEPRARPGHADLRRPPGRARRRAAPPGSRRRPPGRSTRSSSSTSGATSSAPRARSPTAASPSGASTTPGARATCATSSSPSTARRRRC